jgi:hypothetical protein
VQIHLWDLHLYFIQPRPRGRGLHVECSR